MLSEAADEGCINQTHPPHKASSLSVVVYSSLLYLEKMKHILCNKPDTCSVQMYHHVTTAGNVPCFFVVIFANMSFILIQHLYWTITAPIMCCLALYLTFISCICSLQLCFYFHDYLLYSNGVMCYSATVTMSLQKPLKFNAVIMKCCAINAEGSGKAWMWTYRVGLFVDSQLDPSVLCIMIFIANNLLCSNILSYFI